MTTSSLRYLQNLVSGVPILQETLSGSLNDYATERPPIVLVFADVGAAIADNLPHFSEQLRQRIFRGVEGGMTGSDIELKTAMATGLIEALVAKSDAKPELWLEFEKLLGAESMRYAETWRKFGH
jgi:hypothetical protein